MIKVMIVEESIKVILFENTLNVECTDLAMVKTLMFLGCHIAFLSSG